MDQRGKKSAESMVVIEPEYIRPDPPGDLTSEQASEWRAIVGRMPADWFTRETHGLLVQYLNHWSDAKRLNKAVREIPEEYIMSKEHLVLLKARDTESRAMMALARSLRLTNQSRYDPATASSRGKKSGDKRRPWAK